MVLETGQHPGALKDQVTSPGGTTIEGLHELEKGKLRATVISAVRAATENRRSWDRVEAERRWKMALGVSIFDFKFEI